MSFLDRIKNAKNEAVKIVKNIFTDEEQERLAEAESIKNERLQKQLEREKKEVLEQAIRTQKQEIKMYGNAIDTCLSNDHMLLKKLSDDNIEYKHSADNYLIFTCNLKSNVQSFIDYRNEPDFNFFEDDDIDGLQFDFTASDILQLVNDAKANQETNQQFNQTLKDVGINQQKERLKDGDEYGV